MSPLNLWNSGKVAMSLPRTAKGCMLVLFFLIAFLTEAANASENGELEQVTMEEYRIAFAPGDFPALRKISKAENALMQEMCGLVNHDKIPLKMSNAPFAEMGEWPWLASISVMYGDYNDPKFSAHCTGSIVSPWHVITARHCVNMHEDITTVSYWIQQMFIQTGGVCVGNKGDSNILGCRSINMTQTRLVRKIHFSLNTDTFNYSRNADDIAIYEVSSPFEFNELVRPVCVGHLKLDMLYDLKQVGYGQDTTFTTGVLTWIEIGATMLSMNISRFIGLNAYNNYPKPHENRTGSGACPGDSGGPTLVRSVGSPRYFLYADLTGGRSFDGDDMYCGLPVGVVVESPFLLMYIKWICETIGVCREPIEMQFKQRIDFLG